MPYGHFYFAMVPKCPPLHCMHCHQVVSELRIFLEVNCIYQQGTGVCHARCKLQAMVVIGNFNDWYHVSETCGMSLQLDSNIPFAPIWACCVCGMSLAPTQGQWM